MALFSLTLLLSACNLVSSDLFNKKYQANGALSIPNVNCGSNDCFTGEAPATNNTTSLAIAQSVSSSTEIANYGTLTYQYFNNTVIPKLNEALFFIEAGFLIQGLSTCAQIEAAIPKLGYEIAPGKTIDILATGFTSPFGAPNTTKTFEGFIDGVKVARVSIGCSGTVRSLYVKVTVDSNRRAEAWIKADSSNPNTKSVEVAMDNGVSNLTMQFIGTTQDTFTLGTVGVNFPNPNQSGQYLDFALFGQANLSLNSKLVKISYSNLTNATLPTLFSADDPNWAGSPIQHCYSDFSLRTINDVGNVCTSLNATSPTVTGLRGSGNSSAIIWTIGSLSAGIPAL